MTSQSHISVTMICKKGKMEQFKRFAVYYAPRPGAFATAAAAWLGHDAATGEAVAHPDLPKVPRSLAELTQSPRKYGFHGTLRAPFFPAPGLGQAEISDAVESLAGRLAPARTAGLALRDLHGFIALVPHGDLSGLGLLAAEVLRGTDLLRAAPSASEIARRRPETLTERQRQNLDRWGYPYVMEDFTFHLTLTDRLDKTEASATIAAAQTHFAGLLPEPFVIDDLCLFGEDMSGRFHLVRRFALHG